MTEWLFFAPPRLLRIVAVACFSVRLVALFLRRGHVPVSTYFGNLLLNSEQEFVYFLVIWTWLDMPARQPILALALTILLKITARVFQVTFVIIDRT